MIRRLPPVLLAVALLGFSPQYGFAQTRSPERPPIVLTFPDNLGLLIPGLTRVHKPRRW